MNKQELIEELENRKTKGSHIGEVGFNSGLNTAIDLVKQLDEPKKVVVPKFVADFIEDGNHYDKIAFLVHQKFLGVNSLMRECPVKDWLMSVDYETVLSLVNSYEVEKEPTYVISVPNCGIHKHYLARFINNNFEKPVFRHIGEEDPLFFKDKARAAVIAGWVKGKVEKWEEDIDE